MAGSTSSAGWSRFWRDQIETPPARQAGVDGAVTPMVQSGLSGRDFDAEHRRIMDAALARDADAAVAFTVEHFIETSRVILAGEMMNKADVARTVEALRRDIRTGTGLS